MKAIVYDSYGPPEVLRQEEVGMPTLRGNDLLVKMKAVSLNMYDLRFLRAKPFLVRLMGGGIFKPKIRILGADIAGIVEKVGEGETRFKPGDAVFGDLAGCSAGGLAEYARAPSSRVALIPSGLSFEEAAALPMAACTALQALRDAGGVKAGMKVLVYGASGGVGGYAIQIAKALGAELTAACSARKANLSRSLGADYVIDYRSGDFERSDDTYDLILGVNGYCPLSTYKSALRHGGTYVMVGGTTKQLLQGLLLGPLNSKRGKTMKSFNADVTEKDLEYIGELAASGKIRTVIDKRFSMCDTVEAFRYLDEGHAQGKVIITIG